MPSTVCISKTTYLWDRVRFRETGERQSVRFGRDSREISGDRKRMISKRLLLLLVVLALGIPCALLAAEAQQAKNVPRIGFLGNSTAALEANLVGPFREGLRDLGYVEGRNVLIEYRWAEGKYERFPALIAELIALKVDVIVTAGTPATQAVKKASDVGPSRHGRGRRSRRHGHRRVPQSPRREHHRVNLDLAGTGAESGWSCSGK